MEEPKSTSPLSRKVNLGKHRSNSSLEMCNAVKKSKTLRRSERLKKRPQMQKMLKDDNNSEDDDDKEEVEEKIGALKQIVPGGEELGVDMLFEKTAGYILALQLQVKALNYLTSFVQGSEKEKMKLGG
ncbi:hypothetical protein Leryth_006020 [Lithospermum erythrorhizon]|uniref:Uncharacterized protein n=1 Tax=Lithospermum erythrorhizon TaxID=34254 RepID=A0AAV3PZA2_LITER|nr:hypothetical protein Leryth_006020 [Lithospermum erythrorhizon]